MSDLVAGAVLYVADLIRMTAFYESVTGLEQTEGDPTYVALGRGGFQLVLLTTRAAQDHGQSGVRTDTAVKLMFVVEDLDTTKQHLAAAGCVTKSGEWAFGDYRVQDAVDPEGNVLQLRARG